jgi:hypothetical protein
MEFAEVLFHPDSNPLTVTFRIPGQSFRIPGMDQLLTAENLLKAVTKASDGVESWRHGDVVHYGDDGLDSSLREPLPPPAHDVSHLQVQIRLKPPRAVAQSEGAVPEISSATWLYLDARWKAILGQETAIDSYRLTLQGLRAEMEASGKKTLAVEQKLHALNADVTMWTKAKSRIQFTLPKVNEFIHRAVWALGTPERKNLEQFYESYIGPKIPFAEAAAVQDQLDALLKDRQVLAALGSSVAQECRSVTAEIEGTLRTLIANAAVNARKQAAARKPGGKFFQDVRRWTGVE